MQLKRSPEASSYFRRSLRFCTISATSPAIGIGRSLRSLKIGDLFGVTCFSLAALPLSKAMEAGNKRTLSQLDSEPADRNGRNKRRNPGSERDAVPTVEETIYRILCPGNKIGSVIGKGGGIIKSLRSETHAKITIADGIPGVDERVIIISSSAKERKERKDTDDESSGKDGDDKKLLCPAQDALFRVHARIVDEEGVASEDDDAGRQITVRLLVPNNQIGCVIGKGGNVIEKMRTDTGAQIRILPKDQLPLCAMNTDELIQISGASSVVKKALYEVSARLHENPPKGRLPSSNPLPGFNQNPYVPQGGPLFSSGNIFPPGNQLLGHNAGAPIVGIGPHVPGFGGYRGEPGASWPLNSSGLPVLTGLGGPPRGRDEGLKEEFTFQLLCPNEKIGGVIGKGGSSINQVRQETGATIKIADSVPECDERVVVISSTEYADDRVSPTVAAVIQLQLKASEVTDEEDEDEGKERVITTRFLVPSNHIGCLLGKGGSIISEMRKRTRAGIRILSKDNLPKCASKDDELVQIVGSVSIAREALLEIATRLRANIFKDKEGGGHAASIPFLSIPDSSNFGGRQEIASPGRGYPLSGYGLQGAAGGRLSSGTYGGFGNIQGGGSSGGYGSLSGYPTSRTASVGSSIGLVKKNISGTAAEVAIPNALVGSILGRGGSNISQIRQISGAKVKLHDSKPGETDRIVEISGTPEQTHAAESLLQAFAMSGQLPRSY